MAKIKNNKSPIEKLIESNTERKKEYKTVYDEYYDSMFTFQRHHVSQDYLKQFAAEWVQWAMNDNEALKITEFYIIKGISNVTVERWMKRCPELQEAHDHVKAIIGNRREKGAIKRQYDSAMIRSSMPMYDKQWKELDEWRAKISDTQGDIIPRVIVMEKFPEPHRPTLSPEIQKKIHGE